MVCCPAAVQRALALVRMFAGTNCEPKRLRTIEKLRRFTSSEAVCIRHATRPWDGATDGEAQTRLHWHSMESAREEFDRYPSLLRRHLGALYSCPTGAVRTGDGDPGAYCTSARCLLHTVDPSQLDNCNCRWRSSSKAHPPDTAAAPTAAAVVTSDRCPVAGSAATVTPVREIFCRTFQAGIFPRNISDPDESNNGSRSTRTGPRPADSAPTVLSTASSPTAQDGSDSVHTLQKALGRLYEGLHAVRSMEAARNAGDAPHAGVVTARSQDGCVGAAQALLTLETLPPIAACPRLHAGLVPLYSPLVDTGEDGFFFLVGRVWRDSDHSRSWRTAL